VQFTVLPTRTSFSSLGNTDHRSALNTTEETPKKTTNTVVLLACCLADFFNELILDHQVAPFHHSEFAFEPDNKFRSVKSFHWDVIGLINCFVDGCLGEVGNIFHDNSVLPAQMVLQIYLRIFLFFHEPDCDNHGSNFKCSNAGTLRRR